MIKQSSSNMEYRYLGNSGLRVSVVSFGNFVNWNDETLCTESVKYCLEHGINFLILLKYMDLEKLKLFSERLLKHSMYQGKKLLFQQNFS